jgi:hypothetical protein
LSDKPKAARSPAAFASVFVAATLTFASPAPASCRFPTSSTDTPAGVAGLLYADADALGFAVVKQSQDTVSKRPEEIEMAFPLKGPPGPLSMRNPAGGDSLAVTNSQSTFGVPAGTLVFAALRQTRSGWVIGECTSQLLTMFPLATLLPELQRRYGRARR